MVQLTRIYTKSGDKGKTSLGDGTRLFKSAPRFHAIGHVDEANSFIGAACIHLCKTQETLHALLYRIQNDLFDVGADLCVPNLDSPGLRISESQVLSVEKAIDEYNADLPPLKSFVLPGGDPLSAALHIARTVVRRAERAIVELHQQEPLNIYVVQYMNRLSDLLFVLARYVNYQKEGDILWIPGANR